VVMFMLGIGYVSIEDALKRRKSRD
jgi:hypothetical protein